MSALYSFTTLDDAFFFLNQVKGLPDIRTSRQMREAFVRASVVLSWVAVEEGVEHAIHILELKGQLCIDPPKQFRDRLRFVLLATGNTWNGSKFKEARELRNRVVHPTGPKGEPDLTVKEAELVFGYCHNTLNLLFQHKVELGLSARPANL